MHRITEAKSYGYIQKHPLLPNESTNRPWRVRCSDAETGAIYRASCSLPGNYHIKLVRPMALTGPRPNHYSLVDRNDSAGLWLGNNYCCAPVIHATSITFRFTQIPREEVLVKLAKTTITESVDYFSFSFLFSFFWIQILGILTKSWGFILWEQWMCVYNSTQQSMQYLSRHCSLDKRSELVNLVITRPQMMWCWKKQKLSRKSFKK